MDGGWLVIGAGAIWATWSMVITLRDNARAKRRLETAEQIQAALEADRASR